ncbi:hypothetical protein [Streptomyces hirsutus]|uniref:hypothetical protein n=1 Tax=Streptomyces hirsutus TaxID=35620 RepID=UPI00365EC3B4
MRRTVIAATALLLAATAACSSPETKASTPSPTTASAEPTYDEHDCRALLERTYDEDNVHDVSSSPVCAGLTRDEYVDVVGDVMRGRADEILADAGQHVVWDEAWDATDADQQELVCDRLQQDGAETVGQEMADETGDADATEEVEMTEYFLEEKC